MTFEDSINNFAEFGQALNKLIANKSNHDELALAEAKNKWFTQQSIEFTIGELAKQLTKPNISKWLSPYKITTPKCPKNVGLILAGNIPLVGFHDILCTLLTGHNVVAKLSHKDEDLYKLIKTILCEISDEYKDKITFTTEHFKNIDAIIATGSNNSSRYFEYYFGKYPNIIRKNRNSIGIIEENFTKEDAEKLGDDIFKYFGLGCRNVSTLFIPDDFDMNTLFDGLKSFEHLINHTKYSNNYDYQKTLLAMNNTPFIDNGFCLFTPNNSLNSPIACIHTITYRSKTEIENFVTNHKDEIQCIVSKTNFSFDTYRYGEAQKPNFWDYADNIDTIEFLKNLTSN